MVVLIILAIVSAYFIGSSFLPPRLGTLYAGIVLFIISAVAGVIHLKLWGVLYIFAMAVATFLVLIIRWSTAFNKITRNVEANVAKNQYLEKQREKYADDPAKLAQIDTFKDEEFIPGKASQVRNRSTKKECTVSTLVRDIELNFEGHEYSSTVESSVFQGKTTETKPLISVEFLGGNQKDVALAHKLVTGVVEHEPLSSIKNGDWWEEYLPKKGLRATAITEYQEWYESELTSVLVERVKS